MKDDRWEYKVLKAPVSIWGAIKLEGVAEMLNQEGRQGWELVSVAGDGLSQNRLLFLKRARQR